MSTFYNYLIIITAISELISGTKRIQWSTNQFFILMSIINILAEVLIHLFIAYEFPILFVSWIVISDPLFQNILKYFIKIMIKF